MKNSTKITLAVALLGTLGVGSLVHAVNATQEKIPVATISQHHQTEVAEALYWQRIIILKLTVSCCFGLLLFSPDLLVQHWGMF